METQRVTWKPVEVEDLAEGIGQEAVKVCRDQSLGRIIVYLEYSIPIPEEAHHAFISVLFNDQYFVVARQREDLWQIVSRIPASFAPAVAAVLAPANVNQNQVDASLLEDVRAVCTRLQRENAQLRADLLLEKMRNPLKNEPEVPPADKDPKFTMEDKKPEPPVDVEQVENLIEKRKRAIASDCFATAMAHEGQLNMMGVVVEDTPDGTRWSYKGAPIGLPEQHPRMKELRRKEEMEDSIIHSMENLFPGVPPAKADNWVHRSKGMKCKTCMFYVAKDALVRGEGLQPVDKPLKLNVAIIGRCRRNAPTMNGWPVMYDSDWCGSHKLDENKVVADGQRKTE